MFGETAAARARFSAALIRGTRSAYGNEKCENCRYYFESTAEISKPPEAVEDENGR